MGVTSLDKIYYEVNSICDKCYNFGNEVTISNYNSNTQTGGFEEIIDLDSISSIIITKEGNHYFLTVNEI
jgi:hypothetical protein